MSLRLGGKMERHWLFGMEDYFHGTLLCTEFIQVQSKANKLTKIKDMIFKM